MLRAASTPSGSVWGEGYVEGLVAGQVVAEQDGVCRVVVCADDRPECLLPYRRKEGTGGVPDLEFNFIVAEFDPSELEVYADGGEEMFVEFAVHELAKQGALAWVKRGGTHGGVTYEDELVLAGHHWNHQSIINRPSGKEGERGNGERREV